MKGQQSQFFTKVPIQLSEGISQTFRSKYLLLDIYLYIQPTDCVNQRKLISYLSLSQTLFPSVFPILNTIIYHANTVYSSSKEKVYQLIRVILLLLIPYISHIYPHQNQKLMPIENLAQVPKIQDGIEKIFIPK